MLPADKCKYHLLLFNQGLGDSELQKTETQLYEFKFYCGLVNFKNKISQFTDITTKANALFLIHCIYENQQPELCHRALKMLDGAILAKGLKCCNHLENLTLQGRANVPS